MKANFAWQGLYEAAVVETELAKMGPRLREAKAAIDARLHELQMDHGGTPEERNAISDALAGLNLLRREIEARSRDTGSTKGVAEYQPYKPASISSQHEKVVDR